MTRKMSDRVDIIEAAASAFMRVSGKRVERGSTTWLALVSAIDAAFSKSGTIGRKKQLATTKEPTNG